VCEFVFGELGVCFFCVGCFVFDVGFVVLCCFVDCVGVLVRFSRVVSSINGEYDVWFVFGVDEYVVCFGWVGDEVLLLEWVFFIFDDCEWFVGEDEEVFLVVFLVIYCCWFVGVEYGEVDFEL